MTLTSYQGCQHLDPGLPASRTMRNRHLLFKPSGLWHSVTAADRHGFMSLHGLDLSMTLFLLLSKSFFLLSTNNNAPVNHDQETQRSPSLTGAVHGLAGETEDFTGEQMNRYTTSQTAQGACRKEPGARMGRSGGIVGMGKDNKPKAKRGPSLRDAEKACVVVAELNGRKRHP